MTPTASMGFAAGALVIIGFACAFIELLLMDFNKNPPTGMKKFIRYSLNTIYVVGLIGLLGTTVRIAIEFMLG